MSQMDLQECQPALRTNPLIYVIAVVGIEQIKDLERYIPKVQDHLRLSGFPFTLENVVNELTIGPGGIQTRQIKQWMFLNRDKTYGISMSEGKIAIETTAYSIFSEFQKAMTIALEAFVQIVGPTLSNHLGLRYVNILQPQEGEGFQSLLHERLAGVQDDFLQLVDPTFNLVFQGTSPEGVLNIRVHQLNRPAEGAPASKLPLDLGTNLVLSEKVDPEKPYRFLDLDHVAPTVQDLEPHNIIEKLDRLHHTLDTAFKNSVTQTAYDYWAK